MVDSTSNEQNKPAPQVEKQESDYQRQARLAAEAVAEIEAKYFPKIQEINNEKDPQVQEKMRQDLGKEIREEISSRIRINQVQDQMDSVSKENHDTREQTRNAQRDLLTISEMKKQGIEIFDKKTQPLAEKIADKVRSGEISDREAFDIMRTIGHQLVDGVVLSKGNEQPSDFEKNLAILRAIDRPAFEKALEATKQIAPSLDVAPEQLDRKFAEPNPYDPYGGERDPDRVRFFRDQELYAKFTVSDQEFLQKLYKVEDFTHEITFEVDSIRSNKEKVDHIRRHILKIYEQADQPLPDEATLNHEIDMHIKTEVSEGISRRLMDIMNRLYWRMDIERPHKFFDEIEKEDFMQGIETTKLRIKSALERLKHSLADVEREDKANPINDIKLYKHSEQSYYFDERTIGKLDAEGKPMTKPYMRLHPLPGFSEIGLGDYVQYLITNVDHARHRSQYLHDARAIFNHQAHGEKGFFGTLGDYAESLSGTDIDEMMLLPDGEVTYDAFILYDKFVEEEFAANDWKHRPNQFTNSLEEVNTKVEKEVIRMLQILHPNESLDDLRHAINAAVGMARGVFLTETEKSAYADAVDPTGGGMFASYATNDATALMALNPLHVMLRWQGEQMLPMFYFMDLKGSGSAWDHQKTWDNAKQFFESFKQGRANVYGKNLFIDALVNNLGVGGMLQRKGWRTAYSLDGHLEYYKEGPSKDKLDYLGTFKAMDVIGYEAIFDFLKNKVGGNIDGLKSSPGEAGAVEMDRLFKYVFERYFVPFGETDYQAYMESLRQKGEKRTQDIIDGKGELPKNLSYEETVNIQTALEFIENALAREVALRFPSKFLRIDRDRFTPDGVSRFSKVQKALGLSRDQFNEVMKDMSFVETLLRKEISEYAKESSHLFPNLKLSAFTKFNYEINEQSIRGLLTGKNGFDEARINNVVSLWKKMKELYLQGGFLDNGGFKAIDGYKFTFGLEDTDFTLMAMRNTGPRMIARSIKDIGGMESITPWIIDMPKLLNQIATSGKKDISPIIEYMMKAQSAITGVHGQDMSYRYVYRIASAVIQYFKRDSMAKPLFGLFRIGKRNSMAAEYAGRSGAVWEWDSRDIDLFVTKLESLRLLPKTDFDMQKRPEYVDRWVKLPFSDKRIKLGKKRHVDYDFNATRLRKEYGGAWYNYIEDVGMNIGIAVVAFVLWQYIKKALDEAEGKKK